ncbi:MAG: HAD family phosphatase [Hespellia sp.]|nr:HAD family phosphatase [Hespellia sp.]
MKTIIFDLDGVLFDTERYYFQFGKEAIEEMGYTPTDEVVLNLRSLAHKLAKSYVKDRYGEEFDLDDFRARRREKLDAFYEVYGIPVKPEVEATLAKLKARGNEVAAATANPLERAKQMLQDTGLGSYFSHVLSSWEVANGKPAPDVYLDACQKLGRAPEECYAVEDSPNGVRAASDAGCKTIMIVDLTDSTPELDRRIVGKIYKFSEVLSVVDEK